MTGVGPAVRAEWTKLVSVRSTLAALVATVLLTVLISLLGASGSNTFQNDGPHTIDQLHFVHQPLTGDGTVVARVLSQQDSHEWAKAGILVKAGTQSGSPYAALMVTPRHGVRLQGNFDTETTGSSGTAPRWLRLTRTGDSIAGSESSDGATWAPVGTVELPALPPTAEVGLFVTSPDTPKLSQVGPGSIEIGATSTPGRATFGDVSVTGAGYQPSAWRSDDVAPPREDKSDRHVPEQLGGLQRSVGGPGSSAEAGGIFTVVGVGDLGRIGLGGVELKPDTDLVRNSLVGVQIGLVAVVALGVLFMASEFRTGLIRTTLTITPQRGRMLAAKAVVLGGVVFAVGLVAGLAALFGSQPLARGNGFAPPTYAPPSLSDGPVLRAVVGTALFLALLALLSLAAAAVLRSTVLAIVIVVALVVVLPIVALTTSVAASNWVNRVTPNAGLAIQQTIDLPDAVIGPWAGLGVLAAYAAAGLGIAGWRLRNRDA
jgi:hypothetical protein